ncbi:Abi family protein [Pantoea cypripedii]|uniref:Abi family protein n=1 Tax=Pantoea cypripedii TaxID=55209 RepID=UPI002FC9C5D3
MPKSFDFTDMERLISQARLTSYKSAFALTNKAEIFGIYSWNLELSGALNSLIQLVEVALRNAINEAGKKTIPTQPGQHWFEVVPYNLIEDDDAALLSDGSKPLIISPQVKDFEKGINKATRNAQKLLKKKLGDDTAAVPTLDQIISQTDFCVWEYILDKSYYDGDAKKGFLWPKGFLSAFKKLPPVTGKNKQFQQRDIIRRRIESIRMLRNRVAHNEPVWKDADVYDKSAIIQGLLKKLTTFRSYYIGYPRGSMLSCVVVL